jgi:hypothetical protein
VNVLHMIVFVICWMSVVLIPTAKVMSTGIWLNVQHPKNIRIYRSAPAGEVRRTHAHTTLSTLRTRE